MKNWKKRFGCCTLAAVLLAGTALTGCGNKNVASEVAGKGTKTVLKVMFRSDKPAGWEEVEQEVENRLDKDGLPLDLEITWVAPSNYNDKLNLSITGGEKWDLVFDAPFVQLKNLAADGYYADLSSYWNNDAFPGLKKNFSEDLIENNQFFGQKCVIPLLRTYGTGIPAVFYRQDWADKWGIGTIDSYEKLTKYWDAVKENESGVYPLSVIGNRGFYQLKSITEAELCKNGIQTVKTGDVVNYLYIKDGKVVEAAAEGQGDEAFKDFPEGFQYDFGVERYEIFKEWREAGYIETDSLAQTDASTQFNSGLSGSVIGTLDDAEKSYEQLKLYSPEAEFGYFVYVDAVRNMEKGAIATGYQANNFLCIPQNSDNIEMTMKFLDWIFSDEKNHDLIELGIEGKDWENHGDGTYKILSKYAFPGYMLTWNQNFVKLSDNLSESIQEYKKYELENDTFSSNLLPGFTFDASAMATETAQVKAVTSKVSIVKLHGISNDGTNSYGTIKEMLTANCKEAMESGGQIIMSELVNQVNEYLKSKS